MDSVSVDNIPSASDPTARARAIANSFRETTPPRQTPTKPKPAPPSPPSPPHSPPSNPIPPPSPPPRSHSRFRSSSRPRSPTNSHSQSTQHRPTTPPSKRRSPTSDFDSDPPRRVARRLDPSSSPRYTGDRPSSESLPETVVDGADSAPDPLQAEPRHSRANSSIDHPDYPKCPRRQYAASNRRVRGDDQTRDEVIVPSEAVGYIIGKHGETIKSITGTSGTMVAMDKYFPGPDRKFDITGPPAAVAHCRELILRKIEVVRERNHDNRSSTAGQDIRRGLPPRTQSRSSGHMDDSYEMWIPQHKIGMVIGSRGENIRSINERSSALATVVNERVDGDRKLVLIQGSPSAIQCARQLIIDLIEAPPSAGYPRPPLHREERSYREMGDRELSSCDDDANYPTKSVYIPRACVGQVIGKNGSMIRQLQARSRAVIRVTSDEESGDNPDRLVTISGPPRVVDTAHAMIMKVIERGPMENIDSYSDRRDPDTGDSRQHNAAGFRRRGGPVEQTFSLSAEHIGLLIGKNGVTINDIQNRSGALVEVTGKHESERESSTRRVSIVGTKAQVKIARILIEERLGLDDSDTEATNGTATRLVRISSQSESQKENRGDNARAPPTDTTPLVDKHADANPKPPPHAPTPQTTDPAPATNTTATTPPPPPATAPPPTVTQTNTTPTAAPPPSNTTAPPPPTSLVLPSVPPTTTGIIPGTVIPSANGTNGALNGAAVTPNGFPGFPGAPYLNPAGGFPGSGGPMFGEGGMLHFGQFGPGGAHMAGAGFGSMAVGGANVTPQGEQGKSGAEGGAKKEGAGAGETGGKVGAGHAALGVNGFYGYPGPHGMMYGAAAPHVYGGFGFGGPHAAAAAAAAAAQGGFGFAGHGAFVGNARGGEAVEVNKSVVGEMKKAAADGAAKEGAVVRVAADET